MPHGGVRDPEMTAVDRDRAGWGREYLIYLQHAIRGTGGISPAFLWLLIQPFLRCLALQRLGTWITLFACLFGMVAHYRLLTRLVLSVGPRERHGWARRV